MSVLVDTSVWVDYFRSGNNSEELDFLIDKNLVVINDLILAELIPFLKIRKQQKIIELLYQIEKFDLYINWEQIIEYQYKCLKNGLNGIEIPDLIIAQNANQNNSKVYSLNKHFVLISNILDFKI